MPAPSPAVAPPAVAAAATVLPAADSLERIAAEVADCRACPRLVAWREQVARDKRAAFRDWSYWGRAVPGLGAADARIVIFGLAPAAHGANRTGQLFTGDRSGDFLFASLTRLGLASNPAPRSRDEDLGLRDVFITAAVRCAPPANKPTPAERAACASFVAREFALLRESRVVVALGAFAWDAALRLLDAGSRPRPKFGHGAEHTLHSGHLLLGCFHPSQQNTFTGRLTPPMIDAVFERALVLRVRCR